MAWKVKQSVAGLESLRLPLMHETVKMKTKVEWKPQLLRDASNVNCLLRKARLKERPSAPYPAKSKGWGSPSPLEMTS